MDKIIALSDSSPQMVDIDEAKFLKFTHETPIWDYFKISQAKYLGYSKEEKTRLINDYYCGMDNGKWLLILLFGL